MSRLTQVERGQVVDVFVNEIQGQLDARKALENEWVQWQRAYEAEPLIETKLTPWPGASNLVVSLAQIYTDTIVARIMQGIFQMEPHWNVRPIAKKAEAVCNPLERYLDWTRKNVWNQYRAAKLCVLETAKLGTSILYNGWRDEPYIQTILDPADPNRFNRIEKGRMIGPHPVWCPLQDFLIPEPYTDIQTAPWVAMRLRYSGQQLARLDSLRQVDGWDQIKGQTDDEEEQQRTENQNARATLIAALQREQFGLYAPWMVWFQWDLDGDGYPEEYVSLLHVKSKTMMRLRPNTYVNGMRPFVRTCLIEREGKFYGRGIPKMVKHYQEEASTSHNQRIDNNTLANSPMLMGGAGSGLDKSKAFRPGKFILLNDITQVKEFRFGGALPQSYQDEQQVIGLAERAIGLSDTNLGQMSSPLGRAAATTVMAVLQEGTRRHDMTTSEMRLAFSEQILQILELYQQHGLPQPSEPGSPEEVLDVEPTPDNPMGDAALVRSFIETADRSPGLVAIELNVATAAVNREVAKQSAQQLLQTLQGYYGATLQTLTQMMPALMQLPPGLQEPAKALLVQMAKGVDHQLTKLFQEHGAFDLEDVEVAGILQQMMQSVPPPQPPALATGAPPGVQAGNGAGQGPALGGPQGVPPGAVPAPAGANPPPGNALQ